MSQGGQAGNGRLWVEHFKRAGFELRETHISWVLLGEGEVYKIKKPVSMGFLDFGTLEQRKRACEAELALNRRLAPDVYLAVVPLVRDAEGQLEIGSSAPVEAPSGESERREVLEWAVRMRRLSDHDRADVRLEEHRLPWNGLAHLARLLAEFHAQARCDAQTTEFGSVEVIEANVRENFEQTRGIIEQWLTRAQADEIERWQLEFLAKQSKLFGERCAQGRVRDGHGDLRLEHVYFDDDESVRVLDCIEFNDRFRYADVCADIAFLAMDLAWRGRVDLAERFLAAYAQESNDYDLYPLVDFYESYRAYVRGKVSAMVLSDPQLPSDTRERLDAEVRRYFLLSLASEKPPLAAPRLIAVGGVIASGKSTVAAAISELEACPVVVADRTRKHLIGVRPTEKLHDAPWSDHYGPEVTTRVYSEVLRRAEAVLSTGRSVVLDASFRTRAMREEARELAARYRVPFVFWECRASRDVCLERLRARAKEASVSDGRLEIFDDFVARWEPADELREDERLVIDTGTRTDIQTLVEQSFASWRARLPINPHK